MAQSLLTDVDPIQQEQALDTLLVAFAADPVIRWIFPEASGYLRHFPDLVQYLGGDALRAGTVDTAQGSAGAALWIRPGGTIDEEGLGGLLQRATNAERQADLFAFLAEVEEHHPTEPHWYLPFIGVDPRAQGRGLGSELLGVGLARCESDNVPGYLEASSEGSRRLYERHGFETVGEIRVSDSPPLWPMLYRPGRGG